MIEFFKKKPNIATQQFRLRGDIMNYDLNKGGCNCEHEHKCDCGCGCGCGDGGECGCKGGKMLASLLLALGIALGGFFPGYYYYQAKINANSVTVKGLAEMNVKADLAIWNLRFVLTSDDLSAAQKQIDSQRAVIYKFLAEQGFKAEEISDGRIETNDLMANPYRSNTDMTSRFILNQTVTVRSANVDLVDKALRQNGDLVAAGIIWLGAGMSMSLVWDLADVLMGVMAIINIPVICILGTPAIKALKDYTAQKAAGKNPEFKSATVGLEGKTECWE